MESSKVRIDVATVLRSSGAAGFLVVSSLTFFLSEMIEGAPIVQLGILLGFVLLATGILVGRPDFEVFAWIILGSGLLLVITLLGYAPLLVMAAGLVVVCMADFTHTVAIMYPRGGAVDLAHEASRRRLLLRRFATIGATAVGALGLSVLGLSLAPPLLVSGNPAAVVGVLTVAILLLIVIVTTVDTAAFRRRGNDVKGTPVRP
jgi:hypothetical protein